MSILVVGGGKMGLSHLAIINRLLDAGEVALCDSSRLTRYIFGKLGIRTFRSLADALADPTRWQGAVIATPTSSHFPITQALLQRGIPCFIEKPLTLDPAKNVELAALQASRGTVTQMGLVLRFVQPFIRLRSIARSGALGAPLSYRARMRGNVVTKPDTSSWRTDFSRGGGCLNEYGPHLLDLCRSVFGDVAAIESAEVGRVHSTLADDRVKLEWRHASGTHGTLELDWCDTSQRKSVIDFEVRFERGSVRANNAELHASPDDPAALEPEARRLLLDPTLPLPVGFYLRGEEFTLQLELFIERALGRKLLRADIDHELAASLHDGMEVDRLIGEIATMGGLA